MTLQLLRNTFEKAADGEAITAFELMANKVVAVLVNKVVVVETKTVVVVLANMVVVVEAKTVVAVAVNKVVVVEAKTVVTVLANMVVVEGPKRWSRY